MLLPRPKQARNMICAPRRAQKAAASTAAADTSTLRRRYLYRGYLQIAAIDLQRSAQPALWYITWDPTQPTATRPLALVYYNYRYYNPTDGRWINRDILFSINQIALYNYVSNNPILKIDILGLSAKEVAEILNKEITYNLGKIAGKILMIFNFAQAIYKALEALYDVPECVKDEISLGIWMEKRRQLIRSALSDTVSGLLIAAATYLSGGWAAFAASAILAELREYLESLVSDAIIDRLINAAGKDAPPVKCDCTYEVS